MRLFNELNRRINDRGEWEQLNAMFSEKTKRKKATRQTRGRWKANDLMKGRHSPGFLRRGGGKLRGKKY